MIVFTVYSKSFLTDKIEIIAVHTSMEGLCNTIKDKVYYSSRPCLGVVKDSSELTEDERSIALIRLLQKHI